MVCPEPGVDSRSTGHDSLRAGACEADWMPATVEKDQEQKRGEEDGDGHSTDQCCRWQSSDGGGEGRGKSWGEERFKAVKQNNVGARILGFLIG